jgi:hypothetical protein
MNADKIDKINPSLDVESQGVGAHYQAAASLERGSSAVLSYPRSSAFIRGSIIFTPR